MRFVYSNIVYIFKLYNDFHIFRIDLYFFLLLLNFVWFSVIKFWADIFIELPTTLLLISYSSLQNYQTLFCMFVFFFNDHWIHIPLSPGPNITFWTSHLLAIPLSQLHWIVLYIGVNILVFCSITSFLDISYSSNVILITAMHKFNFKHVSKSLQGWGPTLLRFEL